MDLFLIRHGIAVDRGIYEHDEDRPLTAKGIQKMTLVAQKLKKMGLIFDAIFTSPLVRALQTAQILQEAGLSDLLEIDMSLAPDGNLQNWLQAWQKSQYNQEESKLALVGHQPNLGQWTEELVWGGINNHIIVKKAGIIGIELPVQDNPIGNSELFLLTTPKWLLP
jgi:phosphohistidine phosphatase